MEMAKSLRGNVSVGYKDIVDPMLVGQYRNVVSVLIKDGRFSVGVSDGSRVTGLCRLYNLLRGNIGSQDFFFLPGNLRNTVVLAMFAAKVTSHRSDGKAIAPGIKVVERFFFDWVNIL
jgi:hypothetical protein